MSWSTGRESEVVVEGLEMLGHGGYSWKWGPIPNWARQISIRIATSLAKNLRIIGVVGQSPTSYYRACT